VPSYQVLSNQGYFGRTLGSPPGLPGGGITRVLPVSGVGARISGSTPAGGHKTPSVLANLSPSGSVRSPVFVPSGTTPRCGADCDGVQSTGRGGAGGAVCAGGVAGAGGACALATPDPVIITHARKTDVFIHIWGNDPHARKVPKKASPSKLSHRVRTHAALGLARDDDVHHPPHAIDRAGSGSA
jgi:hypothetical protein